MLDDDDPVPPPLDLARHWTFEEFMALPEGDGNRYELLDGELFVSPSPTRRHQRVQLHLTRALARVLDDTGRAWVYAAPTDVRLAKARVLVPDVVAVDRARDDQREPRYLEGGPDLVAEVLSPSTARRDRGRKLDAYAAAGVREYWILDGEADTVEQYVRDDRGALVRAGTYRSGETLACVAFPGAMLEVAELFRP